MCHNFGQVSVLCLLLGNKRWPWPKPQNEVQWPGARARASFRHLHGSSAPNAFSSLPLLALMAPSAITAVDALRGGVESPVGHLACAWQKTGNVIMSNKSLISFFTGDAGIWDSELQLLLIHVESEKSFKVNQPHGQPMRMGVLQMSDPLSATE